MMIGTPDHWHTKIVIDACRAGKDVYCEKPLTLTVDEGKTLCKVVKETGRVRAGWHLAAERLAFPPGLRNGPRRAYRQSAHGHRDDQRQPDGRTLPARRQSRRN